MKCKPNDVSAVPGFAQRPIEAIEIGLDQLAAALVSDLAPQRISGVGESVSRWSERAGDAVDAFAEVGPAIPPR